MESLLESYLVIIIRTTTYLLTWLLVYLDLTKQDHIVIIEITTLLFSLSSENLLGVPSVTWTTDF